MEEQSIITEEKPPSMQALQVSKSGPWSRCRAIGISGHSLNSSLYHLNEVGVVCVSACALGYLQDYRSVLLLASLGDTLNDLHVVHVESANSVAAVVSLLEHLSSSN